MIEVVVNGRALELNDGADLAGVAERYAIGPEGAIVEINGEVVECGGDWAGLVLRTGDRVNFFRIVAGG